MSSVSVSGCWQLLPAPAAASEGMCIIICQRGEFLRAGGVKWVSSYLRMRSHESKRRLCWEGGLC